MRSVVSKNLLVSLLALGLVLSACGKKNVEESSAQVGGSSLNYSGYPANSNLSFNFNACNYTGPVYNPMQVYNYGNLYFYQFNSGFQSQPTASLCAKDQVEFVADADDLQYLIYQSNGQQIGPVDLAKNQSYKVSVDQNAYLYFGRTKRGAIDVNNLLVRRCYDSSNNKISCP